MSCCENRWCQSTISQFMEEEKSLNSVNLNLNLNFNTNRIKGGGRKKKNLGTFTVQLHNASLLRSEAFGSTSADLGVSSFHPVLPSHASPLSHVQVASLNHRLGGRGAGRAHEETGACRSPFDHPAGVWSQWFRSRSFWLNQGPSKHCEVQLWGERKKQKGANRRGPINGQSDFLLSIWLGWMWMLIRPISW